MLSTPQYSCSIASGSQVIPHPWPLSWQKFQGASICSIPHFYHTRSFCHSHPPLSYYLHSEAGPKTPGSSRHPDSSLCPSKSFAFTQKCSCAPGSALGGTGNEHQNFLTGSHMAFGVLIFHDSSGGFVAGWMLPIYESLLLQLL